MYWYTPRPLSSNVHMRILFVAPMFMPVSVRDQSNRSSCVHRLLEFASDSGFPVVGGFRIMCTRLTVRSFAWALNLYCVTPQIGNGLMNVAEGSSLSM